MLPSPLVAGSMLPSPLVGDPCHWRTDPPPGRWWPVPRGRGSHQRPLLLHWIWWARMDGEGRREPPPLDMGLLELPMPAGTPTDLAGSHGGRRKPLVGAATTGSRARQSRHMCAAAGGMAHRHHGSTAITMDPSCRGRGRGSQLRDGERGRWLGEGVGAS